MTTTLYASDDYTLLLLSGPAECPAPEAIGGHRRVGPVNDIIRLIADWLSVTMPRVRREPRGHRRAPIQQVIADGMGVSQRAVSTWLLGTSRPNLHELEPDGVRWLIQAARCAINWLEET